MTPTDMKTRPAHAFGVEVLSNPGMRWECWVLDDGDFVGDLSAAIEYRDEMIEDGYRAEHVRVVGVAVVDVP